MTPPETRPVVTTEEREAAIDRGIAEELARYTICLDPGTCIADRRVVDEAIHALKRREASTRELREEVEGLNSIIRVQDGRIEKFVVHSANLLALIATLEAQLATAREGLERIKRHHDHTEGVELRMSNMIGTMQQIAHETLTTLGAAHEQG